MDNIKILAAVLALAGCMENGMGMENSHLYENGYLVVTNNNMLEIMNNKDSLDWTNIKIRHINFEDISYLTSSVCKMINYSFAIKFESCMFNEDFLLGFPECHNAMHITFTDCEGIGEDDVWKILNATYNYDCNECITFKNCSK